MADRFDRSFPEIALVLSSGVAKKSGLEAQEQLVNDAIDFANFPLTKRTSKKRVLSELGWEGEGLDRRLLVAARLATATFDRICQIELEKGIEKPVKKRRAVGKRTVTAVFQPVELQPEKGIEMPNNDTVPLSTPPAERRYSYAIPHIDIEGGEEKPEELRQAYLTDDTVGDLLRRIGETPLLSAEQEVILAKRIEAGLYAERLLDGREKSAVLKKRKASDGELRQIVEEGGAAKEHMVKANMRLVVNLSKRYLGHELGLGDLIQEASFGLIRAVEKFDYSKGFKFSTYSTWWIKQAITRSLANIGTTIRLPVHQREELNGLLRSKRAFFAEKNREPTVEELARDRGISPKEATMLLAYERPVLSLDTPISDKGDPSEATLGDFLAREEDGVDGRIDTAMANDKVRELQGFLDMLPEREAKALRLRYGIDRDRPMKLAEIGQVLNGVTTERVRQIQNRALKRLRSLVSSEIGK